MPDVFFDNPPVLQGDEKTQLNQLKNYLFTISNKLNEALMTVSVEEITQKAVERVQQVKEGEAAGEMDRYNTLKSMIIKTATIVRHEMDEITTHLEDNLTAVSEEFGELQRNLDSNIRATAAGILQEYNYEERVTGLEDEAGTTESFIRKTNQYIFSGLIDESTMTYGIAVGEGVTAYDAQGNAVLNDNAKCATFTLSEMAFWKGSSKLAWFSSDTFYINKGQVVQSLQIGNFMWMNMSGAMALVAT